MLLGRLVFFAVVACVFSMASRADSIKDALAAIDDTAEHICGHVVTSGNSDSVQVKGEIKAELSGLAKILSGLNIAGAANVSSSSYEGLVQEALPSALQNIQTCKVHIFDTLQEKIIPDKPALPQETETHGWLIPANDPTPQNGCSEHFGGAVPSGKLLTVIGKTGIISNAGSDMDVLTLGTCHSVSLKQSPNGLLVNVDDYDEAGNLLFRIVDNEIHLVGNKIAYAERSADRSTLTVVGEKGDELFMIKYLNASTVRLRGRFACAGHPPITIKDNETLPGVFLGDSCMDGGSGILIEYGP